MKKILSIDGGGIRGIIPAIILAEIENKLGKSIAQLFDLIAGTSTGGILAVGLTKPYPLNPSQSQYEAEEMIKMYRQKGDRIFYEPIHEKFTRADDLIRPKYSSEGRDEVLEEYLRDVDLGKAITPIILTSYDIELRMPVFFVSDRSSETIGSSFRKIGPGFTMKQAAMATSAAPVFFEPYHLQTAQTQSGFYTLVDGGVVANNPTSLAIMETIIAAKRVGQKLDIDDILVVSLGTGSLCRKYPYEEARNWGLISWAEPIVNILMDANSESVASQLEQLLPPIQGNPKKYYRFQVPLNEANDDMDDASPENIKKLEDLARQLIAEKSHELDKLCELLK